MLEETKKLRKQAWKFLRAKQYPEALKVLRQAWKHEKDLFGQALIMRDAAWAHLGMRNHEKVKKLVMRLMGSELTPDFVKKDARDILRTVEQRKQGLQKKEEHYRKPRESYWERMSKEAAEYTRAAETPGFAEAQRKWIKDSGLLEK